MKTYEGPINLTSVRGEYVGLFDFLGDDGPTVVLSVAVVMIIAAVFTVARILVAYNRQEKSKAIAIAEMAELRKQNAKLEQNNSAIRKQMDLNLLNEKQKLIVESGALDLEEQVGLEYKIHFDTIDFDEHIGTGSFGDCYRAELRLGSRSRTVAVKRMRVSMVDEAGFNAFKKEAYMMVTHKVRLSKSMSSIKKESHTRLMAHLLHDNCSTLTSFNL